MAEAVICIPYTVQSKLSDANHAPAAATPPARSPCCGGPTQPSRRGPRPRLDLDAVVDAAIALADEQGLAAVTMRALAARLRVSAMTLYGYVPGKDELVDLMLDALYARMARAAVAPEAGLARAGAGGRRGQPGAVRGAPVGGGGLDRAAAARARV